MYASERELEMLLQHSADVNVTDRQGRTPLMHAAQRGDWGVVQSLLDHGTDLHVKDAQGRTALLIAAEALHNFRDYEGSSDQTEVMNRLLKRGADPNTADAAGNTTLLWAVRRGAAMIIRRLLDHGAAIEAKEPATGRTAFMLAAQQGFLECTRVLLDHGANLEAKDRKGKTALLLVAEYLPAHPDEHRPFDDPAKGRMWTQYTGVLDLLLMRGANVNVADAAGKTTLMWMVEKGDGFLMRQLLKQGADARSVDRQGHTALSRATERGYTDIAKLLRGAGASR
jgi:ankyrin repeat protein